MRRAAAPRRAEKKRERSTLDDSLGSVPGLGFGLREDNARFPAVVLSPLFAVVPCGPVRVKMELKY